jgi:hypothetical protein
VSDIYKVLDVPRGQFSSILWTPMWATLGIVNTEAAGDGHAMGVNKAQLGELIQLLVQLHDEMED